MLKLRPLLLILFVLLCSACKNQTPKTLLKNVFTTQTNFDEEAFAATLKTQLQPINDSLKKNNSIGDAVSFLYQKNNYNPLWLSSKGDDSLLVHQFLNDIENCCFDGIDTARYQSSFLKQQYQHYTSSPEKTITAIIQLDTSLTYTYLKASHDLLFGILTPKQVDSLWFHTNDSTWQFAKILPVLQARHYPSLDSFRSRIKAYGLLQKAYLHYQKLTTDDSLLSLKNRLLTSDKKQDSIALSIIAIETPELAPISDSLNEQEQKIQAYQQYFGIKRTGKLDSTTLSKLAQPPTEIMKLIATNMERMRWLPQSFEEEYVLVNIPMMRMKLMRNNLDVINMNVVVGKPSRQTPALNATMQNIVFNPPWGVPPTILKKDVLPGLLRSGSAYLRKKGLHVLNRKGERVDASIITADNYRRYIFKQAPGDRNALGYVKFNFPNKWDIYMHDTPHRSDFGKFDRAKSSGCIRLQHPQALAKYILNEIEKRNFQQEKIDSLIRTHKTKYEVLKTKIPVHVVYLTAFENAAGNAIQFARDFYHRDQKLMEAISK